MIPNESIGKQKNVLGALLATRMKKKRMRIEEKTFTRINEETYVYTAHVTENGKVWFVQARVDVIPQLGLYKVKGFDCQAIKWAGGVRQMDLIEIEYKAQVIDMIIEQVKELAGHKRNLGKHLVELPLVEG